MSNVTIFHNALDPKDRKVRQDVKDVCAYLKKEFGSWPDTARIYLGSIAECNDVTPHCESEIERLEQLQGDFYVVIWPEDPITIAIIAAVVIAAVAIGLSFLLKPTPGITGEGSPNNSLSDRQNKARPNERIPDIVGTVRSTPDLLVLPYKAFIDNQEYEYIYACIGRGSYTIIDCMDDQTPVDWINGEWAAVYPPDNSPNSVTPAPQSQFGIAPSIIPPIVSIQQSNAVNGQPVRAPNAGNFYAYGNVAFQEGGVLLCNGSGIDWTQYFVASTLTVPSYLTIAADSGGNNASDPAEIVHSVSLAGTYEILSVSQASITLSNAATVNSNWNIVATFSGGTSTYAHDFWIDQVGVPVLGPYILNVANMTEVWANFVAPNGLYLINDNGNQVALTNTIQMSVQAVNAAFEPVGDIIVGTVNVVGQALQQSIVGSTLKMVLPSPGPCQVTVTSLSPMGTSKSDQWVQQVQWRDLFAVSPVPFSNNGATVGTGDFGNVTTVYGITAQTADALSIKERKLNLLVTRNLPTWIDRSTNPPVFSTTLYPTNVAADILCALALDPFIGRRTIAELNVPEIYGIADNPNPGGEHEIGTICSYFGSNLMTEFCYTFDDSKVSFEESASNIAQAINCICYRSASSISLSFEQKTEASRMLFNHRNKIPNSETRTFSFGVINDYDGIQYDYIDPNAPNYPDVDTTLTLYFPIDQSAVNPKKVTSIGVRNIAQATINGWRMYQKLLYANGQTQFEATQEATLRILNDRILVADNTRSETQDGELVGLVDGLLVTTSQDIVFKAGETYTAFFQLYDDSVQAIPVTAGPVPNSMVLAGAPLLPLVTDPTMFARTTYQVVGSSGAPLTPFLVTSKEPDDNNTFKLSAINYTDHYYDHDLDIFHGIVLPPPTGYAPQGYTGSGLVGPSGGTLTGPARALFVNSTYITSPLFPRNNPHPSVTLPPTPSVSPNLILVEGSAGSSTPDQYNFNTSNPEAPTGLVNVEWQQTSDPTTGIEVISASVPLMVGDAGSGGVSGAVPAPGAGAAAAGKYLKADGTFAVPPTIQPTGTANKVLATPVGSTGVASLRILAGVDLPVMGGDSGAGGEMGAVPAPPPGSAAAGMFLKADGTFAVPPTGSAPIVVTNVPFSTGTAGNFGVAHGLGVVPQGVSLQKNTAGDVYFQSTPYDATNLYLTSDGPLGGFAVCLT